MEYFTSFSDQTVENNLDKLYMGKKHMKRPFISSNNNQNDLFFAKIGYYTTLGHPISRKLYHFSQPQSEPDPLDKFILEFEIIKNSTL